MSAWKHCPHCLRGYTGKACPCASVACERKDVRYFDDEYGAVACMDCGRLFGHLLRHGFEAYNPTIAITAMVERRDGETT